MPLFSFHKHGVITWFSEAFQGWLLGMHLGSYAVFGLLVAGFMFSHYFFAITTAHISAMFLAFLIVGTKIIAPELTIPFFLMMMAAGSIMMCLTHYATGTSPIIFGSGFITMGERWRIGLVMSLVDLLVFAVAGAGWWKLIGYY